MLTRTNRPNTSLSAFVVPGCAILTPSAVHLSARVPCHLLHFCCLRLWGKNKSIVFIFFLSLPTLHQMDKHKGTCCVAQHNTHAALCGLCRRHPWTLSKFSQPVRSVLTSEVEKKKRKGEKSQQKMVHPASTWLGLRRMRKHENVVCCSWASFYFFIFARWELKIDGWHAVNGWALHVRALGGF